MRSAKYWPVLPIVLLLSFALSGQNVNPMHPVEIEAQNHPSLDEIRRRAADVLLQKDAKELAELCSALPNEMSSVKQGLLPKDILDNLKRVEKLSKRVREQLARSSTP
jgi:hypothetical protein